MAAGLTAVVVTGSEPCLGNLDVTEVALRRVDQGRDLGPLERDRAAFGIVFVVAGGVCRVFDDLLEVAGESIDPPLRPDSFVLESPSCRVAIRGVHLHLR